jgi:WD40 repeat protein
VRIWNLEGASLHVIDAGGNGVEQIVFSRDGDLLITRSTENAVRVWKTSTWEVWRTLRDHQEYVIGVAISHDGRALVTGSADHTARLWDLETSESRPLLGHIGDVRAVAFTADGKAVFTAGEDGTVRRWPDDLPEGDVLLAWLRARAR